MESVRSEVPGQVIHLVPAVIVSGAKLAGLFGQGKGPGEERADARHIGDDDAYILFNTAITKLGRGWESASIRVTRVLSARQGDRSC